MRTSARILVVDDEPSARFALKQVLQAQSYQVELAGDGEAALECMAELPPDLVVTDLEMPRMSGLELLRELRRRGLDTPLIIVTGASAVRPAVDAMREGAVDYLTKPIEIEALLLAIERALEQRSVRDEHENLLRQLEPPGEDSLSGLLGTSPAMQDVYRLSKQVAPARATVLLTGESGTGKGELARAIHARSPRAHEPFIAVHCAALAERLLESELFGHERGSFTGAERRRAGRFEQADGGTLFLDEIGEISPSTQIKLLTFLQERRFERVGGNDPISVDVRIIAATHRDLAAEIGAGRFRQDLFYRLNVVHIELPPLRARGGDILLLAEHFLRRFARENDKPVRGFSEAARQQLREHRWPGNVRELENAIERAVVMCDGEIVDETHLPRAAGSAWTFETVQIPGTTLAELEKFAILKTLAALDGSTQRAAEVLDLSVRTIQYRLHEYGVARNRR